MKSTIVKLLAALIAAEGHLDYCGWGDNWERECAYANKIPDQLSEAIALGAKTLKELE